MWQTAIQPNGKLSYLKTALMKQFSRVFSTWYKCCLAKILYLLDYEEYGCSYHNHNEFCGHLMESKMAP